MAIVLGLTGNIACGKSTVGKIFREMGIDVLDSDEVVQQLYENDKNLQEQILAEFSSLDKKQIATEIFGDSQSAKEKREILESIIHPAVDREFRNWVKAKQSDKFIVNLVPLIYEAGLEDRYDYVICVKTREDLQIARLKKRNPDLSEEDIVKRIKSQMPQELKTEKADYLIDNSGNIDDLEIQIEEILEDIVR